MLKLVCRINAERGKGIMPKLCRMIQEIMPDGKLQYFSEGRFCREQEDEGFADEGFRLFTEKHKGKIAVFSIFSNGESKKIFQSPKGVVAAYYLPGSFMQSYYKIELYLKTPE